MGHMGACRREENGWNIKYLFCVPSSPCLQPFLLQSGVILLQIDDLKSFFPGSNDSHQVRIIRALCSGQGITVWGPGGCLGEEHIFYLPTYLPTYLPPLLKVFPLPKPSSFPITTFLNHTHPPRFNSKASFTGNFPNISSQCQLLLFWNLEILCSSGMLTGFFCK